MRGNLDHPTSVSGSMVDSNTDHSVPKGSIYKRDMTSMFEMSSPRGSEGP